MATPGLESVSADAQDTPDETTTTAVGKAPAAKGPFVLPTATGNVGVDPALLENMRQLIAEREARKGSFMENLKDATAWWSGGQAGPGEALRTRAAERDANEATTFGMKSQLAQYKMAEQQAKSLDKALFGTGAAATPSAATAPGQATQPGQAATTTGSLLDLVKDPGLRQSISTQAATGDRTGAMKEVQKYLLKNAEDPQMVKELNYMINNKLIDPKLIPAAVLTKFVGSGAFVPHDVRGVAGTAQGTPFSAAAGVSPGGAAAPATTAAPAPAPAPAAPATTATTAAPAAPAAPAAQGPAGSPFVKPPTSFPPPPTQAPAKQPLTTAAPAQTPRVASPFAPGTKEDLDFQAKNAEVPLAGGTEFAKETEKANAVKATQVDTAGLSAGERKVRFNDIKEITEDPEMQVIFGKLAKKGLTPFVLKQLESGVNAGQFGTMGVGNLERNLMEAGATKEQILKLHKVEKHLGMAELDYAKTYLTGQGAVSDNERKLVKDAVGNVKDPATVLKMQASVMAERAEFDEKVAKAYNAYRDAHGEYASFGKFMRSSEATSAINDHNAKLAQIIGRKPNELGDPFKGGASGPAADHPGKSLVNQYLNKGK